MSTTVTEHSGAPFLVLTHCVISAFWSVISQHSRLAPTMRAGRAAGGRCWMLNFIKFKDVALNFIKFKDVAALERVYRDL